ncbi:DinB family protein [Niabella insulamsoli]|uniref:DinB family protein n=1 Tax=Niabella insulamsoli TaxID=3144874 RepID=UPI0031FC0762
MKQEKEVWLSGVIIEGITPLLQPVAHALLQAAREIRSMMSGFEASALWQQPAGCASPGFHLLHIRGVLDRLLTYAENKTLTEDQFIYLKQETDTQTSTHETLVDQCIQQISETVERLKNFKEDDLVLERKVGRAQLPSTVIGLCTHAAEHTMRHVGQLLVTIRLLHHKR